MLKREYIKILDWLEDFISSRQAEKELGNNWEEEDLVYYIKNNKIYKEEDWLSFYTLFFKKEKYIIKNNVLIKPCLEDITKADDIPNTVNSIKYHAFAYCTNLTSITIPDSVKSIEDSAFEACFKLTSVTIPNSVTSIGSYAFDRCSGLTKVNYLGTIDQWVMINFADCTSNPLCNAKNLYINNELVTELNLTTAIKISSYAFFRCSSLTNITIPNSVKSIGEFAFAACTSLTNITIPNSVTSIGEYAFSWCTSLTNITIPNSVTKIGKSAFYRCNSLTTINFKGTKEEWEKITKSRTEFDKKNKKITIHCSDGDL